MLHSLLLLVLVAVVDTAAAVAVRVVLLARPLAPLWRVPFTRLLLVLVARAAVFLPLVLAVQIVPLQERLLRWAAVRALEPLVPR